jgi:choloylglycine hydrolase
MIGMAVMAENYPLYFDATNEKGLSMAGLNFPGNAVYFPAEEGKENIPSYDFIPYILTRCRTCNEAKAALKNANICDRAFSENQPTTPLHWLIADKNMALVAESTKEGFRLYENPTNVMTNSPPFPAHLENLRHCTELPGGFLSEARFLRAAYVRRHGLTCDVGRFFRMLDVVSVPEGCVKTDIGYQRTIYSCCCDTEKGIYYYTTAENRQITAVDMHKVDLEGNKLYTH